MLSIDAHYNTRSDGSLNGISYLRVILYVPRRSARAEVSWYDWRTAHQNGGAPKGQSVFNWNGVKNSPLFNLDAAVATAQSWGQAQGVLFKPSCEILHYSYGPPAPAIQPFFVFTSRDDEEIKLLVGCIDGRPYE